MLLISAMKMESLLQLLRNLYAHVEAGLSFTSEKVPGGNLSVVAACAVAYLSIKYLHYTVQVSKTKQVVASRQAKAEANKARLEKRLAKSKIDIGITELSFEHLRDQLQSGVLKPSQVLLAYQAKALEITKKLNCVTEFIENAEERAAILDRLDSSKRGPLHGIPVSLKEVVGVKGCDCTAGITAFVGDAMKDDGALLKVLVSQGAIPFARTNISQGQMSVACSNPLFGTTLNPHNLDRTPGGSSGGEGALIGAGGSPIGLGCDMGGSIRVPSHFCGIAGMKPTPNRVTGHGNYEFGQYILTLEEVYGPLGRDVTACVEMFKAMLIPQLYELDPLIPQIPWRDEIYSSTRPLKIGYYINNGSLECVPAVKRCVLEAKKALESRGHKVVEFEHPDVDDAAQAFFQTLLGDNLDIARDMLKYDAVDPALQDLFSLINTPYLLRLLLSHVLPGVSPSERKLMRFRTPGSIADWWGLNEKIVHYRHDEILNQWKSKGLDGLICPVLPFPAFPIDQVAGSEAGLMYTAFYNVANLPCGSVPVGKVEARDIEQLRREYPRRYKSEQYVHKTSENTEGLPIGVQCVALPFQEEMCLRIMKELEESFRK